MNIIQQRIQTFKLTDTIIDLVLLFFSARLAIITERIMNNKSWNSLDASSFNFYAIFIIFFIWLVLIFILENGLIYRRSRYWNIFKTIALISFIGVTSTISLDFLLKSDLFKRSTIIFFGIISFLSLLFKRFALKYFLSSIRQEGFDPKNILIIGSYRRAERIVQQFSKHKEYGFRIRAILDPDPKRIGKKVDQVKVSGDLSNVKLEIKNNDIDEVFFACDLNLITDIHSLFIYLDTIGINYHMMVNESVHSYADKYLGMEPVSTNYYGMPMLSFSSISATHFKLYIKDALDKVFALLLLVFTFPILIFFGILIKITSKGPIIFKQERVGLNGRKFYQYKLRSMVQNAERLKAKYLHLNEQDGPVFKIKHDPRLTKLGIFIRKYSIDELPQLFNVLNGSMNLIGPRPPVPSEVEMYEDLHHKRLSMKPGITGLWQVSGRNNIKNFNDWVRLDVKYIDNWSFTLDLKIAFKTISTILSGSGV